MKKLEFMLALQDKLSDLPQADMKDRLNFYSEMIDDRMEEGLCEEEAVSAIGSVDEIAAQIVEDIPFSKIAKERLKAKRRLKAWAIVLLVLGSPIWFSLAISAIAVVFSLYVSVWAVIVSLWAVFVSVIAGAVGGILSGIALILTGHILGGTAVIGGSIVCAGVSIFLFCGCKLATAGILLLTKKIPVWIKNCFIKKEAA